MREKWSMAVLGVALIGALMFAFAATGEAAEFNWKQAQGTEVRFLACGRGSRTTGRKTFRSSKS